MTIDDHLKREGVLWLVVLLLTALSLYAADMNRQLRDRYETRIDSLQTVHQQTKQELQDQRRLANSHTEGLSGAERREVLWATRAVLSETKNPREMLLIANVIRNRVDMTYRGKQTAKEVILDPYQFSAFNPGRDSRWRYAKLEQGHVSNRLWRAAWNASRYAMTSRRSILPITDRCVTHFVHPRNLRQHPDWIYSLEQLRLGDVQRPNIALFRQNKSEVCQIDQSTSEGPTRLR